MTLVSLGLRPSLRAAARAMPTLLVKLAALYDKVNRTEPAILRALVCGSAERLALVAAAVDGGTILPGGGCACLTATTCRQREAFGAAAGALRRGAAGTGACGL